MTTTAVFETAQLFVRPINGDKLDLDRVAQIASPEVTRHLPDHLKVKPGTKANPADWVARLCASNTVSTIADKAGLVGFLTLRDAEANLLMLGYLFAEETWGKGYATELVAGLVSDLQSRNWSGVLRGGVVPENTASARVLLKRGFAPAAVGADGVQFYERRCGARP